MSRTAEPTLTRNQEAVLRTLQGSGKALGAYQILSELQDDGLSAPPQVYRALDRLCSQGLVHRIESLNAFVACNGHRHCHEEDAAFAICENCSAVAELPLDDLQTEFRKKADTLGFAISRTRVELMGLCAACQED